MTGNGILSVAAAIVTVTMVAVIVRNGTNTARVIKATGDAFAGSLRAAQGL